MKIEEVKEHLDVRVGGSYFGSGGHSAGYKILQGNVIEEVIDEFDNGFIRGQEIRLKPAENYPSVLVKSWDYDCIGGYRETGINGIFRIFR